MGVLVGTGDVAVGDGVRPEPGVDVAAGVAGSVVGVAEGSTVADGVAVGSGVPVGGMRGVL